ncbi:unnamed protein product [Parascedosporium putredinis]|uniref:WD40 repeat-like protein n=1 Tax=Parascedosporium putredinis TaxID=1442378 RepID=A0A9P1MD34_9PEZI|nr:unnamed protein product [Parascedosporium putredinis]CAI7999639.1 unnamed protein product [Parascedosporium putredinis]
MIRAFDGDQYSQRFYRARPSTLPLYSTSPRESTPSNSVSTPKANDSRNRAAPSLRDSPYGGADHWSESPTSKTWTSPVGETGYCPRVLIFSLQDSSSDLPLVSISEHTFGVRSVAWSQDGRFLASLGAANDGFLYIWRIDPRTGAAKLSQQNRCTSFCKGMVWMGNYLVTFGVRHVKAWKVEDVPNISPVKSKFGPELNATPQTQPRALSGRNILLGSLIDCTFTCAAVVDDGRAILCTDTGDVCVLEDDGKQMKLQKALRLGFSATSITLRDLTAYVGGKADRFATLDVTSVVEFRSDCLVSEAELSPGLLALGCLSNDNLVTIDTKHSINVWDPSYHPGKATGVSARIPIPGQGEPIIGVQCLSSPNPASASFMTCREGDLGAESADLDNQVTVVESTKSGSTIVYADKLGVLRAVDFATKEYILDTKAHSCDCQAITIFEDNGRLIMASCGRDRTVQLFHRPTLTAPIEHFQTLEFAAKVVKVVITEDRIFTCSLDRTLQVHDIVTKEGQPEVMAAIPSRVITLKSSPTCMTMGPTDESIFVSLLDRSVCQYDILTGRLIKSFKCTDESGIESAVLDSLVMGKSPTKDFLLGVSNTDKSVRLYDSMTGSFLDREWGHTEAINGIALVEDTDGSRKVYDCGRHAIKEDLFFSIRVTTAEPQNARHQTALTPGSEHRREEEKFAESAVVWVPQHGHGADVSHELRLTATALGDRAVRSKTLDETILSGLLDQYSERLATLLDEKLRLSFPPRIEKDDDSDEATLMTSDIERPKTSAGETTTASP